MLRGYSQLAKESKEQEHGHRGTNSNQNQDRWDLCMKCICFLCRNMLVHHNLWFSGLRPNPSSVNFLISRERV